MEDDWLITEASSFQLETTKYFKPVISAILNLTPDHLNRHHTMDAYGKAKAKIFENQSEDCFLIINYDDKVCFGLAKNCKAKIVPFSRLEKLPFGVFLDEESIVIKPDEESEEEIKICDKSELKIIGNHNVENVLAAVGISYFAGIEPETIKQAVIDFRGVEHRIEYCGMIDGVKYYNDSKGTNVDAAITALKAIEKNIILIAGGDGKGQDFSEFAREFEGRVKYLILLGKDAPAIKKAAEEVGFKNIIEAKNIPECVLAASRVAEAGDTVLLSPACASWDMYDNYEQRGEHFKDCVENLGK